jgi:hypothetical protein
VVWVSVCSSAREVVEVMWKGEIMDAVGCEKSPLCCCGSLPVSTL